VTVSAGQTSATFAVSTTAVVADTAVSVSATANGTTQSGGVTVLRSNLKAVTLNRSWTVGGTSKILRVLLDGKAPVGGLLINLASDNAVATVPATVTVPAGADQTTVTVTTTAVAAYTTVTLSASNNGNTKTVQLDVLPPSARIRVAPTSVSGGTNSTGTVTLDVPAPVGGYSVALSSDNVNATVPASVLVPAGQTSQTFTVTTKAVTAEVVAYISASTADQSSEASLTIKPVVPVSVSFTPASVNGGSPSTGRVTLSSAAPTGGIVVNLTSDSPSATVPSSVTVGAGQTSVAFVVTTSSVTADTMATISGSASGTTVTNGLNIKAIAPTAVTFNPTSVIGGTQTSGTVTLSGAAPAGGVVVTLSWNSSAAAAPATVTVTAGQTAATFVVATSAVSTDTSVSVTASANGFSKSGAFTITRSGVSAVAIAPSSVVGGSNATGTVTLTGPAPDGGLTVALASDS
jgi:hypothetical protein